MSIATKRSIISLYSNNDDVYSHQVRIVLAEKGVNVEIFNINFDNIPKYLLDINPYGTIPTLLDRDLVLYESRIIMEYLDERFPHPPLFPVYPVARAELRKMMHRIDKDWYSLLTRIKLEEEAEQAKILLYESLINLEPIYNNKSFFLSDEFSLIDCYIAPLLWRLPKFGVYIPNTAKGLHAYMKRIFTRNTFQNSLSDIEKKMR